MVHARPSHMLVDGVWVLAIDVGFAVLRALVGLKAPGALQVRSPILQGEARGGT